jgi:trk/ktr system potassium uptake protein
MANSILKRQATPPQALALGFAVVILIGAFLLTLPVSTASKKGTPFIDALYTSTSAVCVTGLIVLDTPGFFSTVGQVIILLLIQIGGLGYMTMASMIALTVGRRISLRERVILRESLNQLTMEGLIRFVKRVLWITFIIEAIGGILLTLRFLREYPLPRALFFGVFHSVSAFCNAGFSLFSTNLEAYVSDPLVNLVITSNIIIGGIGYLVIVDLYEHSRNLNNSRFHLSVHAKLALTITASLIVAGTVLIYLFERNNGQTLGPLPFSSQILASYFHAVTPRTAGYNTLRVGAMTQACLFFTIFLMFVGASPGGTGGGIKTTTFGTLVASTWSNLRGRKDVNLFRRLSPESIDKAFVLTFLSLLLMACFSNLLLVIEKQPFLQVLFEEVSAFGTVGLSSGAPGSVCSLSAIFSPWGKLLIILTMYAGRVGPITVGAAALSRESQGEFRYVEEKVLVG